MVSVTALIEKLTDIERSIGVENNATIRFQVIDAQDCVLLIQKEIVEILGGEPPSAQVRVWANAL
jgi:hypothetical protein